MKAVHLCIDMQGLEKEKYPAQGWDELIENVKSLIDGLDKQGVPTIYVGNCPDVDPFREGAGRYKDSPPSTKTLFEGRDSYAFALPVAPDSVVAYKGCTSIYQFRPFANYLAQNEYTHVFLSGVSEMAEKDDFGRRCVSLAAVQLADAGYQTYIVAEATNRIIPFPKFFLPLETRQSLHKEYGVEVIMKDDLMAALSNNTLCARLPAAPVKKLERYHSYG